ncbi:TonB-dependent receptor [Reichenbachiella sp. MSK19-1]|uniref:TonB-dependent receptor n=1 Tax=Reichenbachiella sp. MSK19-1 TaxID=1897631 RepID=UPI000E6BEF1B|nr:TonB-dependent receptor [Reichenbachiella sp. MSK19-1]RJE75292.1 hypothetical protein BGP76_19555 [Reichenbachiella sp. MSK19-1]
MRALGAAVLVLLCTTLIYGQNIEGKVTDQISGEVLIGAAIELNHQTKGSITTEKGLFQFQNLVPGLYEIQVSYLGYERYIEKNIWVKTGKTVYLNIQLARSNNEMDEVVVTANTEPLRDETGNISITEEKINRYAATYYDPARLVLSSPDVMVTNDQNNQISVRGLSPELNVWRLEGVEIVNPNHLSNAGTFNDQPAATGGGVNILSAQMLDRSQFHIGAMDNSNNNAVAGLFDMDFRDGYAGDHQFTAQASLIGLDFSAEGPLKKGSQASYLANYRYSFTGLLGLMGVDFGGEVIGFQDLSFNVHLPLKNKASLNVFALGGLSSNEFKAKSPADVEIEKDKSDISYREKMGGIGSKYNLPLSNGYSIQLTSLFSSNSQTRNQTTFRDLVNVESRYNTENQVAIWSNRVEVKRNLGHNTFQLGSNFNHYDHQYQSTGTQVIDFSNQQSLLAPYLLWEYQPTTILSITTGGTYYLLNANSTMYNYDYRAAVSYKLGMMKMSVSAGKYSQVKQAYSNFTPRQAEAQYNFYTNGFIESYRYLASTETTIKKVNIQVEGFYYYFPSVSVIKRMTPPDYIIYTDKQSQAQTSGVSLRLQGMTPLFYYDIGGSLFNSTYEGEDLPYNLGHSFSASVGEKWFFNREGENRVLSANLKGMYQGGMYQPENDRLSPYGRIDIRISWAKNKKNTVRTWSLDIQNLTNRQNEAFQYYDSVTGQIEMNYQLGLLPILTYRIEF